MTFIATAMTEAMNSSLDPNMIEKMLLGALKGLHICFITWGCGELGLFFLAARGDTHKP